MNFLLLVEFLLIFGSIFQSVGEKRVFANQYHEQCFSLHGPPSIIINVLIDVVCGQEGHRLNSDQSSTFGTFPSDQPKNHQILNIDGDDAALENENLQDDRQGDRVNVSDLCRREIAEREGKENEREADACQLNDIGT